MKSEFNKKIILGPGPIRKKKSYWVVFYIFGGSLFLLWAFLLTYGDSPQMLRMGLEYLDKQTKHSWIGKYSGLVPFGAAMGSIVDGI